MVGIVQVNKIVKPHKCSSTAKVITSMADQAWVAEKAIGYLQSEPNIGGMELLKKLQAEYKCTIGYDTVQKGKERAANMLYMEPGEKAFRIYSTSKLRLIKDLLVALSRLMSRGKEVKCISADFLWHLRHALMAFWLVVDHISV